MKRPVILFCILTFFSIFSVAAGSKKFERTKALADEIFEEGEFIEAQTYYEYLDSISPGNPDVSYKLGVIYLHRKQYDVAEHKISYAQKNGYGDSTRLRFNYYYGRLNHLRHKLDKAQEYYLKHKATLNEDSPTYEEEADEIDWLYEQCNMGKKLMKDALELKIRNIGSVINTQYDEYVPLMSADDSILVFTSKRPNANNKKSIYTDEYHEDIYISYNSPEGWTFPVEISPNINSATNDACVGLTPDGQKLFIYRSRKTEDGRASGDIYESNLEGNEWGTPIMLGNNINSGGWEPSASIYLDRGTLYFVSDRPGGYGGTDIYSTQLDEHGEWQEPQNLGEEINTEFDEDAPYIHVDGRTLYFSSKGHNSMGGFDVFHSTLDPESGEWTNTHNIGYPVSTADDDTYLVWSADGRKGYFSSRRKDSYGAQDIYEAVIPHSDPNLAIVKGFIKDSLGAPVEADIIISDNETKKVLEIYSSNKETGKYVLALPHGKDYNITVESDEFVFYSDHLHVPYKGAYFEVKKDIKLNTVKPGAKTTLNNIFFDFNSHKLRDESELELQNLVRMMKNREGIKIEIASYTDNVGKDKYNKKLSKKRSKSVVKYIKNHDVKKKRMVAVGYGETSPIGGNDTEEGRQLNRRTEFKILKVIEIDKYGDNLVDIEETGVKSDKASNLETYKSNYAIGETLPYKVHFPYNQSQHITDYSKGKLDRVVKVMKTNTNMRIKIHAHTDPLGSNTYNKELSKRRGYTVYTYLLEKGIDSDRIEIATYGEDHPVVEAESIYENVHNRRVEFEILQK